MFAETFQLLAVSPAAATNGAEKVTTVESKVKSPWKPTKPKAGSMFVVRNGSMITVALGTELSKVSVGRLTFTCLGVAVGVAVAVAVAVAVDVAVAVAVDVAVGVGVSALSL